jgi:ATP-binding cassette subfamily B (MDR/TAP) protein 1
MAMPLIALFNMIGCMAISFAFGWKLTIVTFFGAVPFIISANFLRIRFELQFEKMNAEVFAESSQFAAEAISASRTVYSLTLEDMICQRYAGLLKGHLGTTSLCHLSNKRILRYKSVMTDPEEQNTNA